MPKVAKSCCTEVEGNGVEGVSEVGAVGAVEVAPRGLSAFFS